MTKTHYSVEFMPSDGVWTPFNSQKWDTVERAAVLRDKLATQYGSSPNRRHQETQFRIVEVVTVETHTPLSD